jgi:putative transposase
VFFVDEHNTTMPHAAFRGQTPDEVFFGTAPNLSVELDAARAMARELRPATNRSASCGRCASRRGIGDSAVITCITHLRTHLFGML